MKQLTPGSHTYQFAVDVDGPAGEIIICDPYARALADDSAFDPPRAVVEVARPPYGWRHNTWARPAYRDLILYELHVGDFSPEGSFRGVIDRLDYLRELGINAIELMPIFEFKGDLGWGYNPAYFFTVEKSYGEPDDLRTLIDEAHARGIAVVLDLVLAHTAHRHPFNRLYPYDQSPWYGPGCGEPNQFGFPSLDYSKGPTQDFSRDVQTYWLREFHVDGFRYDYCNGIGNCDGMGVPHLVSTARAIRPDVFLIGEFSPEKPDQVSATGLDGAWHVSASYGLKALLCQDGCGDFHWDDFARCVAVLQPWTAGYQAAAECVNYLESHDEQRVVNDMRGCGASEEDARRRSTLGAVLLFTMPGEPMLYHGQEFGEGTPRTTNDRNRLHWEEMVDAGGRGLHEQYRKLWWLRRDHPALRTETYSLDASYPEQKALVYHRWNDEGDEVVVAANFSPAAQSLTIPFPHPGRWCDAMTGQTLEVTEGQVVIELPASSGAVYMNV
jgi:1,4-alpha-glucan branching enzyme